MYPGHYWRRGKYYRCYICERYSRDIVVAYIDGENRTVCIKCFLAHVLHETIRHMLKYGREDDLNYVVRVLEGINDLVEDNPLAQAIRYVIDVWSQKYPRPLTIDELRSTWRYRYDLDKVLSYLASEGILVKAKLRGSDQVILAPGNTLRELLRRFPTSRGFFHTVIRAITGLAVVRYLADAKTRKIRNVYATLQALAACIDSENREPIYEVKGYRCKLCKKMFSSKTEVRSHIYREHLLEIEWSGKSLTEYEDYVEVITGEQLGEWCKLAFFIAKAGVYGVKNIGKYLRYLLTRGVIHPQEGGEIVTERNGEKYVAVDNAWIRVRENMRMLERQLVRRR